jgi:cation diffusion facilitator family transporter
MNLYHLQGHGAGHATAAHELRAAGVQRVTLAAAAVNAVLVVLQVIVGLWAQSQALVADGLHTLADLTSDLVVFFGARQANLPADERHPYGHRRIETLITAGLGGLLIAVALGLAISGVQRLLEPQTLAAPGVAALLVAAAVIAAKEGLYRYTLAAAARLNSQMLRASAWHHRSDAISSVIVLLGIGGAMLGVAALDVVAALAVAGFIVKIGWDLLAQAVEELIDTGLDDAQVQRIREAILAVDGVKNLHLLRTRLMAGQALADVHIQVSPRISVSEGHRIAEAVRAAVMNAVDAVDDVMVHTDPEDDETNQPCDGLPLRGEIEAALAAAWAQAGGTAPRRLLLHYLDGKIEVDVVLPPPVGGSAEFESEAARYRRAASSVPQVRDARVSFG